MTALAGAAIALQRGGVPLARGAVAPSGAVATLRWAGVAPSRAASPLARGTLAPKRAGLARHSGEAQLSHGNVQLACADRLTSFGSVPAPSERSGHRTAEDSLRLVFAAHAFAIVAKDK
jgi:hypothetical protein